MEPSTLPTVHVSSNYNDFKFMGNNRDQYTDQVQRLKRAIEEFGNITQAQPVLVNERMEIVDGQHRFLACKELGLPVFYLVGQGLGINEARSMNILHKSWSVDDFAKSYADGGDQNYARYLRLREDYGFSHSVTLTYVNAGAPHGEYKLFREGNYVLSDEMAEAARARLNMLESLSDLVPMVKQREFAMAFMYASNREGYEHKRMMSKIEGNQGMLVRLSRIADYQRLLEEIYNRNVAETKRVRLF